MNDSTKKTYTAADYDTAMGKTEDPEILKVLQGRKDALSAPAAAPATAPTPNLDTYGDAEVAEFEKKLEPAAPVKEYTAEDYDKAIAKSIKNGVDPATIEVLENRKAALPQPEMTYNEEMNMQRRILLQGVTLGLSDEIYALGANLPDLFDEEGGDRSWFGDEGKLESYWDNIQEDTKEASIEREQYAQANPGEAFLLELTGSLLTGGAGLTTKLGVGAIAKGTQLATKAGMGAKTAGVVGAGGGTAAVAGLEGLIYGTATLDNRLETTREKVQQVAVFTAMGFGFGGVLGSSFKAMSNWFASRAAAKVGKTDAQFETFLNDVSVLRKGVQEPDMTPIQMVDAIMEKAGIDSGWNPKDVERAIMGDLAHSGPPTQTELELMNSYRAADKAVFSSAPASDSWKLTKAADYVGGAINTRIRNSSPTLSNLILKSDHRKSLHKQQYEMDMEGFARLNRWNNKGVRAEVKVAWLSNDVEKVAEIIAKTGDEELIAGFAAVRKNNKEIADSLRKSGVDVPEGEYLPRRVKDAQALRKRLSPVQNANAQAALAAAATRKYGRGGKPAMLTEREVAEVYSDLGYSVSKGVGKKTENLTSARERTVSDDVAIENSDLYYDPLDSAIGYMREGVDLVENRLMMFGSGNAQNTIDRTRHNTLRAQYKKKPRKQTEAEWIKDHEEVRGAGGAKITLEEGIENMIRMSRAGGIPTIKEDEMRRLLMVRFGKGEESAPKWVSDLKNIGLMSVLATPKAAALQITEIGHSFAFNGAANTAKAIARSMMPANANRMTVKNIGMMDTVAAELNGDLTSTSKVLGKLMSLSGFKSTDRFGKNIYLDAAQLKATQQLKSPKGRRNFERKWSTVDPDTGVANNGGVFTPDEISKIGSDLDNGVVAGLREGESPELALLMFHELSGIQPLTLSQLPEGMLGNPSWRFMYTLKSFSLKQADIIRTKMIGEYKKGSAATGERAAYHYKEAMKNTMAYTLYTGGAWTLGNEARQAFFSFGADPIELDPSTITASFVQHALTSFAVVNKYSVKDVGNGRFGGALGEALIPPMPLYEAGVGLVFKAATGDLETEDFGPDGDLFRSAFAGTGELMWHIFGTGQETKKKQYEQRELERRMKAAGL